MDEAYHKTAPDSTKPEPDDVESRYVPEAERRAAEATLADVGEVVQREVRLGHPDAAARAVAGLRPLIEACALKASWVRQTILRWMHEAGEPSDHCLAMAGWLGLHLDGTAGGTPAPVRTFVRAVIEVAPGNLSVPSNRDTKASAGTLAALIDEAEDALLSADLGLYQRAGTLVRAVRVVERDPKGGDREVIRTVEVSDTYLIELMGKAAQFERFNAKLGCAVAGACPPELAKGYLARKGIGWRLPELKGIIHAPTLRDDGSVLDMHGYDARTGLIYDTRGGLVPHIPQRPTKADAKAALDSLETLLDEFPFVDLVDWSVALAAILTATIRRSLPTAPLFAFTAPTAGTGKSALVSTVSMIAHGQPASGITWSDDDAENGKRIDAALIAGLGMIALDNVTAPIGGNRLCQIMTEARATVRPLGQSKLFDLPCGALVTANGNNLTIAADMTRRSLLCRLDAGCERPELRTFLCDPIQDVRDSEGGYLAAALTVLRAYHVAGRPAQPKPFASFEAWSSWVRGALLWLDQADPVESIDHVRADDPALIALTAVLEGWNRTIGGRRVTSAQIINETMVGSDFREALLVVAGAGGNVNTNRLGKWLGAHKGKLVGALKLERAGVVGGTQYWALAGGRATATGHDDVVVPIRAAAHADVADAISLAELLK